MIRNKTVETMRIGKSEQSYLAWIVCESTGDWFASDSPNFVCQTTEHNRRVR